MIRLGFAGLMVVGLVPVVAVVGAAPAAAATPPGHPVVVTQADGGAMVFIRHPDGSVYRRVRAATSDEWDNWANTGHLANGDPAVGHDLDGRLEVFARGQNNHLWRQAQSRTAGWDAWQDMGTPPKVTLAGEHPVVVTNDNTVANARASKQGLTHVQGNTDGRLEIFVVGSDNGLWHRAQTAPNGTGWSDWESLGSDRAGNPSAVVTGDGRIALFSRTTNGHLWHRAQIRPSTEQTPLPPNNWSPWLDLGAGFNGDVAVATYTIKPGTLLQMFGNGTDGRLWTITQTKPGTSSAPNGTWGTKWDLGNALTTPPVVAANTDGRLAVFGVNANHLATYRVQTGPAGPAVPDSSNPNGIWEGGWPTLDQQLVRSAAVEATARGRLEVFAVDNGSNTLYQRAQLAAGTSTAPRGIWLDWTNLAPIGAGPCGGLGTLACLNITNVDLNMALDLQEPTNPNSYIVRSTPDQSNPPRQQWALRPSSTGNTFSIVNNNGKCIHEKTEVLGPYHLQLWDCDPNNATQQWYLEPVTPTGTSAPTEYRIRQVSSNLCLTALQDSVTGHDANQVERIDCTPTSSNDHKTWRLGRDKATAPGVLDLALKYAADQCATHKDTATCKFVDDTHTDAYQASDGCVASSVLFNNSSTTSPLGVAVANTIGTQFSLAGSLKYTVIPQELEVTFTATHTWVQQETRTESVTVNVPPQQFGWVTYAPVRRETVGHWEITLGKQTWTVPGHNISEAKDGTSGMQPLRIAETGILPPTEGQCPR